MPTTNYGIPYKGSKSRIVDEIAEAIPYVSIDNFYDIFAGGCAVTHKMMLAKRYKHFYANDLDGQGLRLFLDAIAGKFHDEKRWISREDFLRLKDTDQYVACCWSFGNNGRDYLYSQKIEPYKKACHYAIVLDDFSLFAELCPEVVDVCKEALTGITDTHERRIKFGPTIVNWLKANGTEEMLNGNPLYSSCHTKKDTKTRPKGTIRDLESLQSLQSLESLQRIERLQSLESLERLQSLQRLESSFLDYRDVEIKPNSIIYCDPPYKGTDGYNDAFDHEPFYDWCCRQTELVVVSEYTMPADRFAEVYAVKHRSLYSQTVNNAVMERLFVPTCQLHKYKELMMRHCCLLLI